MANINEIHTHAQKKKSAFEGVGQEKPSLTHGTSIDCYSDLEITVEHFKTLKDLVCDIFFLNYLKVILLNATENKQNK